MDVDAMGKSCILYSILRSLGGLSIIMETGVACGSIKTKTGEFRQGVMQGLPIFMGYVPAAMAFGVLGTTTGFSISETTAMSVFVFAGASQFMALNLIQSGINIVEIIIATFVLNMRHLLMSTVLVKKIEGKRPLKSLVSFGITDETFVLSTCGASGQGGSGGSYTIPAIRFAGLACTAYCGWVLGTVLGAVFANILPPFLMKGMGISLYAMFIALLVPTLKKSGKVTTVAGLSAMINWVLIAEFKVSGGWSIVSATMLASAFGALVYKEGRN